LSIRSGGSRRFSTGWYCGSSSTKVSGNQSSAPLKLPRKKPQPGKSAPPAMRVTTITSCDASSIGRTCSACCASGNQSMRRDSPPPA
jgi:hypothetical protein